MFRRLTTFCLAAAMVLTLAACGKHKDRRVKDVPVDVFRAIEAVRDMKNCTFDLSVSDVNEDSGEAGELRYTVSGAWYSETHQATAQVRLADDTELTTFTVDGKDLYADLGTAASVLSPLLADQGANLDADDVTGARNRLKEDAVHFALEEDLWTALEGDTFSQSRENLKALYQKVKKGNAKRVRLEKKAGRLSLGLGDLQGTLLDITDNLTQNKSSYIQELSRALGGDLEGVIGASGLNTESLLNEKWFLFQDTGEELAQLQSDGDFNGWTARLLTRGDGESGYGLELTLNFNQSAHYALNVYPAQPKELRAPDKFVEAKDVPESAWLVLRGMKEYLKHPDTAAGEENGQELTEEEAKELFGLTEEETGAPVETQAVEGSEALLSASFRTSDGGERVVPLLKEYDSLRDEGLEGEGSDLCQNSGGYVLEYTSIEKRDLAQTAEENAQIYAQEFEGTWDFDIVAQATPAVQSADGSTAAAAMAYHDVDLDQDVTVYTCCLSVEESRQMIYFDLFVYSKSVTDAELEAIGELMAYLGVEPPLEIIQN